MKIAFVSQEYVLHSCEYAAFVDNDGITQLRIEWTINYYWGVDAITCKSIIFWPTLVVQQIRKMTITVYLNYTALSS
jgi:hypothetical protein